MCTAKQTVQSGPRYKFGDVLKRKHGSKFTVKTIKQVDGKYYYHDDNQLYDWALEEDLRIYKEPKTTFTRHEVEYLIKNTIRTVQREYKDKWSDSLERAEIVIKVMGDL